LRELSFVLRFFSYISSVKSIIAIYFRNKKEFFSQKMK
jgi:hypothetical protein